jgi:ketosteroid isomerase-like protein
MSIVSSPDDDLRAIEAVNQRDVQFALANDVEMMTSQWTDDFVLLQPAAPIMRGRGAIAEQGSRRPRLPMGHVSLKIMRILQRQTDGAWKIHRTMATVD